MLIPAQKDRFPGSAGVSPAKNTEEKTFFECGKMLKIRKKTFAQESMFFNNRAGG